MTRPRSLLGLTLAALRARHLLRPTVAVFALALAGLGLAHRAHPSPVAPAWAEAQMRDGVRGDENVFFHDLSMIATRSGYLLAWVRWERGEKPTLQVAALDGDGKLRGAPATLSSGRVFVRYPHLARGANHHALVWTTVEGREFRPHVWFASLDDEAKTVSAPRVLSDEELAIASDVAPDLDGWAVGWTRLDRPPAYTFARVTAGGELRGAPTHIATPSAVYRSTLSWNGTAWVAAFSTHQWDTDESAVQLAWIDRSGRVIARPTLARARGMSELVASASRGASTWLVWGEDTSIGSVRHDPRIARLDDRDVAQPPRALGPRRSGGHEAIACNGSGCTLAWAAVEEHERGKAEFYVQRVDGDGTPRGPARIAGARGLARPWSSAAVASADDDASGLAAWTGHREDRGAVLVVKLTAEGVPSSPPRVLPLP